MNSISLLDAATSPANQSPGPGHNQPPGPPTAAEVSAYLDDSNAGLIRRRDELVAAVDAFLLKYPTIETDDVQAAATENLGMLRKLGVGKSSRAEETRETAKKPFLEAGRAVDAWFKVFTATVEAAHARLCKPATDYAEKLEAERRRVARVAAEAAAKIAEEAAREAELTRRPEAFDHAIQAATTAQAATSLAEARPAEHSRTIGTYGSVSSLRAKWAFEVHTPADVPRAMCVHSDQLIRAAINAGERTIPGVRIYEERKLATRS